MLKEGTVPINYCAAEFYTLQALEIESKKLDPFKKSHEHFLTALHSHKERFESMFSVALRDYLVYACFGEARNSRHKCNAFVPNIPHGNRRSAALEAKQYSAKSVATVTSYLFDRCSWADGYGGSAWSKIADAIVLYDDLPTVSFIDHCVDLSHNGGAMFDKTSYDLFELSDSYTRFLDYKSQAELPHDLLLSVVRCDCHSGLSFMLQDLISRAELLGLISDDIRDRLLTSYTSLRTVNNFLEEFTPTEWGTTILSDELVDSDCWCHECDFPSGNCHCEPYCHECDQSESNCVCNDCPICGDHLDDCDCCHDCENTSYNCTCEQEEECFNCGYAMELCTCDKSDEVIKPKFFQSEGSVVKYYNVRLSIKQKKAAEGKKEDENC